MTYAALALLMAGFLGGQLTVLRVLFTSVSLLDVAVVGVLIAGAMRLGPKRFIPTLAMPILAFVLVAIVSNVVPGNSIPAAARAGGMLYLLRWFVYAALYWVAADARILPAQTWKRFLLVSGIAFCAVGILQWAWYPDLRNLYYLGWDPHFHRLFATLLDPNFAGIIATVTLLLALSWQDKAYASVAKLGTALSAIALFLTYSRSSLLAAFAGILMWSIVTKRWQVLKTILVAFFVAFLLVPRSGEGQNLLRSASSLARVGSVARAVSVIAQRPLFGVGFNALRHVSEMEHWSVPNGTVSRSAAGFDTSILFVGATTGVVGIAVYLWLIGALFTSAWRTKDTSATAVWYLSFIASLSVHSLVVNSAFYPWVLVWLWIGIGIVEQERTAKMALGTKQKRAKVKARR